MPTWTSTTNCTTHYTSYMARYLDGRTVCHYEDRYARSMQQAVEMVKLDTVNLRSQLKIALNERKTATVKPNMEETF